MYSLLFKKNSDEASEIRTLTGKDIYWLTIWEGTVHHGREGLLEFMEAVAVTVPQTKIQLVWNQSDILAHKSNLQ